MNEYELEIKALLSDPNRLKQFKPFTRGVIVDSFLLSGQTVSNNGKQTASLPDFEKAIITQEDYMRELDPQSHKVLFDDNIPSIAVKLQNNGMFEVEQAKVSFPYQQKIVNKKTLHLCGYPTVLRLASPDATEKQNKDFMTFKEYWNKRNMDGLRTEMVRTQLSLGIVGKLYYFDRKGQIKARILSYDKGYVLCPHDDANGDRILESVYYMNDRGEEVIDSYDDTYMYRHVNRITNKNDNIKEWILQSPIKHGFSEIPLITKRGKVAWDDAQSIIDQYERIYNIFVVIMKRHGWGILVMNGKFNEQSKKLAGNVVLEMKPSQQNPNPTADFKSAPSPQGMFDMLESLENQMQLASNCTFILPKDIKMSGNISGLAIQLTQSGDNEIALLNAIDWQNVINKDVRLFKEGLAKELVNRGINKTAVTDFENLNISANFKVWMPKSQAELMQNLSIGVAGKFVSRETAMEECGYGVPQEKERLSDERDKDIELQQSEKKETIDIIGVDPTSNIKDGNNNLDNNAKAK